MDKQRIHYYIPNIYKVGKGGTATTALTMKQKNGAWYKPTLFKNICGFPPIDNPRDSELVLKRDMRQNIMTYKNEIFENPIILNQNCYQQEILLKHPVHDFCFKTTVTNFMHLIIHEKINIVDKKLIGKFIFGLSDQCAPTWHGNNLSFISVQSDSYINHSLKEQQLIDAKKSVKKLNLVPGKIYRIYESKNMDSDEYYRYLYLGYFSHVDLDYENKVPYQYRMGIPYRSYSDTMIYKTVDNLKEKVQEEYNKALNIKQHVFIKLTDTIQNNVKFADGEYKIDVNYRYNSNYKIEDLYIPDTQCEFSALYSIYYVRAVDKYRIRVEDDDQTIQIKMVGGGDHGRLIRYCCNNCEKYNKNDGKTFYITSNRKRILKDANIQNFEYKVYNYEDIKKMFLDYIYNSNVKHLQQTLPNWQHNNITPITIPYPAE